jgi:hypothetical protein
MGNIVRIEILSSIRRVVKDHKHDGHSMINKILLKSKIVTSNIYMHTQTQKL